MPTSSSRADGTDGDYRKKNGNVSKVIKSP